MPNKRFGNMQKTTAGNPPDSRWRKPLPRFVIAVLILLVGVGAAVYLKKTAPRSEKRPPRTWVPLVTTVSAVTQDYQTTVSAMGTVTPSRRIFLKPQVAGRITALHPDFVEGGLVARGAQLVQIEEADYALALARARSDLVNSRYLLRLEEGRQTVARREWDLLGTDKGALQAPSDTEGALALRKPHLEKARADMAAATAAVDMAKLDLARTRVTAPFNAMVLTRSVNIGSQASVQEALAELVGTDTYWIRVTVPVGRLPWIDVPRRGEDAGAVATVYDGQGGRREGRVVRLLGDLSAQGRMARLLVSVPDPFGLATAGGEVVRPLLIGAYVRVEIMGRKLAQVFVIPRTALRDNDTLWLLSATGTLEVRPVTPLWRDETSVVLDTGLGCGEQVIVSELAAPVPGMALRVNTGDRAPTGEENIATPGKEARHG